MNERMTGNISKPVDGDDCVIRVSRKPSAAALEGLRDYAAFELTRSRSQLTKEQAAQLAEEVKQAAWKRVRHLFESDG